MLSVRKKASIGILAAAGILPGIFVGLAGCGGPSDIALPSPDPLTPYRLATYRASDAGDGAPRPAIVIGDTILDLAAADALFATETGASPFGFAEDLIAVIAAGDPATARLNQLANHFRGTRGRVPVPCRTASADRPPPLPVAPAGGGGELPLARRRDGCRAGGGPRPGRALPVRQVAPAPGSSARGSPTGFRPAATGSTGRGNSG